jgi:hypothetical protein
MSKLMHILPTCPAIPLGVWFEYVRSHVAHRYQHLASRQARVAVLITEHSIFFPNSAAQEGEKRKS